MERTDKTMAITKVKIPEFVFDHIDNLESEAYAQGHTLKEIGAMKGMQAKVISNLHNGEVYPTQNNYNKIADVLNWEVWQ